MKSRGSLVREKVVASLASEAIIEDVRRTRQSDQFRVPERTIDEITVEIRSISFLIEPTIGLSVIAVKESDHRVLECLVR